MLRSLVILLALVPCVGWAQLFTLERDDSFRMAPGALTQTDQKLVFQTRIANTDEAILNARLVHEDGREIFHRQLVNEELGIILGTTLPDAQFTVTRVFSGRNAGSFIISGLRDDDFLLLQENDLFMVDLAFGKQCFSWQQLAKTQQSALKVNLLVDISGSMKPYISDIHASMGDFLRSLPAQAQCSVAVFDEGYTSVQYPSMTRSSRLTYTACSNWAGSGQVSRGVQVGEGGTNITQALSQTYRQIGPQIDDFNLLMLLTDAQEGEIDRASVAGMLADKSAAVETAEVYTFANWLGNFDTSSVIRPVADGQHIGRVGNQPVAQSFFRSTIQLIENQVLLTPRQCD